MYKPAFTTATRLLTALALLMALAAPAQADNTYRAEIVILERLAEPVLREQMADRHPTPASACGWWMTSGTSIPTSAPPTT